MTIIVFLKYGACFHRVFLLNRKRLTYSASGVSVSSGNEFVRRISPLTKLTLRSGCTSSIGGFGGLFDTSMAGYNHPVLVAGTDGVGTKLLVCILASLKPVVRLLLSLMSFKYCIKAQPMLFITRHLTLFLTCTF